MKTLALACLAAATLVWVGWTERRHRLQSHQIALAGGTKVVIEYNIPINDTVQYGNGQHLLSLREAVKIMESIVADERKKETR
jgi:hypothetical protein